MKKIKKDTKIILSGRKPFDNYGIVNPPIYRTSTVLFKNIKELGKAISNRFNQTYYGRYGTPTTFYLEEGIAEIENAYRTIATSSGMSSISITLIPKSFACFSVSIEVGMPIIWKSSPIFLPSKSMKIRAVDPVPSPTVIPFSTNFKASLAALIFEIWLFNSTIRLRVQKSQHR